MNTTGENCSDAPQGETCASAAAAVGCSTKSIQRLLARTGGLVNWRRARRFGARPQVWTSYPPQEGCPPNRIKRNASRNLVCCASTSPLRLQLASHSALM